MAWHDDIKKARDIYDTVGFLPNWQRGQEQAARLIAFLKSVRGLVLIVLHLLAYPLLIVFRHHHGERRLRLGIAFFAFLTMIFSMGWLSSIYADGKIGLLADVTVLVFIGTYIAQNIAVTRRRRKGIPWHSRSSGVPWLTNVGMSYGLATAGAEPLIAIIFGNLVNLFGSAIGWYFIAGGISIFVIEAHERSQAYDAMLDIEDRQLEAEELQAALEPKQQPLQTSGVVVPGVASWTPARRQRAVEGEALAISPALRALLDEVEETPQPSHPTGEVTGATSGGGESPIDGALSEIMDLDDKKDPETGVLRRDDINAGAPTHAHVGEKKDPSSGDKPPR